MQLPRDKTLWFLLLSLNTVRQDQATSAFNSPVTFILFQQYPVVCLRAETRLK